jgi:adenylate kinase family enzyme
VKRIAVIGNGGGGKSTLARTLGERLAVPVHEVDLVQFRADWSRAPQAEVTRILDGWLAGEAWIIDGAAPWPALGRRLAAADTIVWIDLPLRTHLWWTAKRRLHDRRRRPSLRVLFRSILHVHRRYRPAIERGLEPHAAKVVRLRTSREVRRFLEDSRAER